VEDIAPEVDYIFTVDDRPWKEYLKKKW